MDTQGSYTTANDDGQVGAASGYNNGGNEISYGSGYPEVAISQTLHVSAISRRAGELLAHALRIFRNPGMDWVRRFMLTQDPSVDAALLTSPVQLTHASTVTLSAGICEASGRYHGAADGTLDVDYLFVPAFTINDHSVGLVVERRRSGPFGAGAFSIAHGESVGKFCMNIKTAETLIITLSKSLVADTTFHLFSSFLQTFTGSSINIHERARTRPLSRIIWSGAKRQYIDSSAPPCGVREELAALCDTALLNAGRFQESIVVSNVSGEISREACSMCAEKALSMMTGHGIGPFRRVACNCRMATVSPESPLDFSNHDVNMQVHGGIFNGATTIMARIPGTGNCVTFQKVMNGVVKTAADKSLLQALQKVGLKCRFGNANLLGIALPFLQNEMQFTNNGGADAQAIDNCLESSLSRNQQTPGDACSRYHSQQPLSSDYKNEHSYYNADDIQPRRRTVIGMFDSNHAESAAIPQPSSMAMTDDDSFPTANDPELEDRVEIRRRKNREAAARSNARRKERNDNLQKALHDARERAAFLRVREQKLRKENLALRRLWEARTCRSALSV